MFEKVQKIHTKPGTVATFDNYGKKSAVNTSISDHKKAKK